MARSWLFDRTAWLFAHGASGWSPEKARELTDLIPEPLTNESRVLDIGGGTGQFATILVDTYGSDVTILDASERMLSYVTTGPRLHALLGDATAMPFEDAAFDVVTFVDAFHHVADQVTAAREIARVLRPGGTLVVSDPNAETWIARAVGWGERLVGESGTVMTPTAMEALFAEAGFEGDIAIRDGWRMVYAGQRG